jgi:hypothetical protein
MINLEIGLFHQLDKNKMKYYYLHVWGVLDFDYSKTEYVDRNLHPPVLGNVSLEIDSWPTDDLFQIWPLYFVTERLRSILTHAGYSELKFTKTKGVKAGQNFRPIFGDSELPKYYWRMDVEGIPGRDNFGLWDRLYLVVSEPALQLLKDNFVYHAEADLISVSYSEYFSSHRKDFWMNA